MITVLIALGILLGCILVGLTLSWPAWILIHAATWDGYCCNKRWRLKP